MNKSLRHFTSSKGALLLILFFYGISAKNKPISPSYNDLPEEVSPEDSTELPYTFKDESIEDPLYNVDGGLRLNTPSNIKTEIQYDPVTGQYNVVQKMGNLDYRPPTYMDGEEYIDYQFKKSTKDYWKAKTHAESNLKNDKPLVPKLQVGGDAFDRIFGGNTVEIRPNGSVELIFGTNTSKTSNPAIPVKARKVTTFDFNEKIQLNVVGKIGDKLKLSTNYNTEATFDFENQMKMEYNGYEDDIIKKIEAGNVALPLTGSLITGSQSLFGLKTELQFGKLTATTILSQQKGKKSEVEVKGGAQTYKFEVNGDNYEANKHFFLSHYFRDTYEGALASIPAVLSQVNITKIEVWVTNRTKTTDNTRNILALTDLGEDGERGHLTNDFLVDKPNFLLPDSGSNNVYTLMKGYLSSRDINSTSSIPVTFQSVQDYEKLENAKKLTPSEFTLNPRLGYISVNQSLNYDEVLAVAYQYTYNGKVYQVGEFSTDGIAPPQLLFVKMLKSTNVNPRIPMWDLMMKNVYALGAYQVNPQDFRLDILYNNSATGVDINYIPAAPISGKPLLQVMNLDRITSQGSPPSDGVFDFIDGLTITASNGRIFFPALEPFGSYLKSKFNDDAIASKYIYQELYDSTRTNALQFPSKNRFKLKGTYQSNAGSEISLNAINVPQGSVVVTAGGIMLVENVDYTVDYNLGRVKIINQGVLNSGTPVKISLESNTLFSMQTKSLIGTHLDYRLNKDFTLGGTLLRLSERPITTKVTMGDEPISNTIWGVDGNYRVDAPILTRIVDKIPLISTKEKSSITASGEFAQLIPGHSKVIGDAGNSYIDDFEGSQSAIDMRSYFAWTLASTPQNQPELFPEGNLKDSLTYGFNRAKLAWYVIDPMFLRQEQTTPPHLNLANMSNNFSREILETEIFPNKQQPSGQPINIAVLDLAYYPSERGPYNYDVAGQNGISSGLNPDGSLKNPQTRWAGIMRKIDQSDFEATNVEYVQFWMMDPFNSDYESTFGPGLPTSGELYLNLGNISEDILKDGRKSYENGLPPSPSSAIPVDTTVWGIVPEVQAVVNSFDADPQTRLYQDVGLDGLTTSEEQNFFSSSYLQKIGGASALGTSSTAYTNAVNDPSGDNYHHFRGDDFDNGQVSVLERYKRFNDMEGNSATQEQSDQLNGDKYPTSATQNPNVEDINNDNTVSENESYYQYKIKLTPVDMVVGQNYITDVIDANAPLKNGATGSVKWYQFKIPVRQYDTKVGNIEDYKGIRFMRLFFKNFDRPVVCRFARLELLRGDWRKYNYDLFSSGQYTDPQPSSSLFDLSAVNLEENGQKTPVNYILPPGITRQTNPQTVNLVQLNEQALSLKVCNLQDGEARAIFKNADIDVRSYKKLQLFSHAEERVNGGKLVNGDLNLFVRLGSDYTDNYYEYEIPLQVTPPGSYNTSTADVVWPELNNVIIEFARLQEIKQKRNIDALANPDKDILTTEKVYQDGKASLKIKGSPNLSSIKTIMVGVRNPKQSVDLGGDDGLSKCAEVWINELRLTDFDEKGGWAALGRVSARLADFATVSVAGNYSTPGFGSIEKKVSERQRETIEGYDISSNMELGKFIPQKVNIKIPTYVGYSQMKSTPQFNPLDPDIKLKDFYSNPDASDHYKDSIRLMTEDITQRKSLNFTNVKKERGKDSKKKAQVYDIENFAVSYAYTELKKRNTNIEYNNLRTYRAGLTYGYSHSPKNYRPFAKVKLFDKKAFALIKDVNFFLLPSRIGFTTDLNRQFNEVQNRRTISDASIIIPPFYNKSFTWARVYDLKYDLTKALKFDFNATNDARIIEPYGKLTDQQKDSIFKGAINDFGKNTHYRHAANLNYTVPLSKIPILDFASATARYGTTYEWMRAPIDADSLGNTIQNSNSLQLNGQLNMVTLYNKVPYLKKINQKPLGSKPPQKPEEKNPKKEMTKKEKEKLKIKLQNDTIKWSKRQIDSIIKAKDKKKEPRDFLLPEYFARTIMSVRNASFTYTENKGTQLGGYNGDMNLLGMDSKFKAPTTGFVMGSQKDIRPQAVEDDWLYKTIFTNPPFTQTHTNNYSARASIEPPIRDLKIELTATRNFSRNYNEIFKWVPDSSRFVSQTPNESGNFSMSFLTFRTAFQKEGEEYYSQVFQDFLNNRSVFSAMLAEEYNANKSKYNLSDLSHLDTIGYKGGYRATSQEVLIPSFLAAYSGSDPDKKFLETFPKIPMPNWRVTYDGLSKIKAVKKYFKSITLSHAYRSTYNVSSYVNNLNFNDLGGGYTSSLDLAQNVISQKQITTISISEQFSPLVKADLTLNNNVSVNMEFKKDRNLSLGLTSFQVTEINGREIVVGSGYRFKDVVLPIKKMKKKPKSDINVKADVSIRHNRTALRKIVENVTQVTQGQNIISIKTSADYALSDKVNLRLFFDKVVTKPLVSNSFRTSNANFGLSLRMSLAQ